MLIVYYKKRIVQSKKGSEYMEFETIALWIGIAVVAVVCFIVFINMMKNKTIAPKIKSTVNIDSLIEALGSVNNIIDVKSTQSKVTVTIKENDKVNFDQIKALGASGIVAGKDSVAMIFGKESPLIEEDLKHKI